MSTKDRRIVLVRSTESDRVCSPSVSFMRVDGKMTGNMVRGARSTLKAMFTLASGRMDSSMAQGKPNLRMALSMKAITKTGCSAA